MRMHMRHGIMNDSTFTSGASSWTATYSHAFALCCLIWSLAVHLVSTVGTIQLRRFYRRPQPEKLWDSAAPHVTIIRPIKGEEPFLYECLASTCLLRYPRDKLHIRLCIDSRDEPSIPLLRRLVGEFPEVDVEILVEAEDERLRSEGGSFGPNPKIRNMSRAYREAVGDIIWIIDCNVWISKIAGGRMIAQLMGSDSGHAYKLVHQLPLVVETSNISSWNDISHVGGGRLDETFMSSAHAKFYTAINTVSIAPCIVGKSTMFRRSDLDGLTGGRGIDYFAANICEDHLIGDLLWKGTGPGDSPNMRKHGLCFGDLAIQPLTNMSLREYWNRRVRWLRVRKFTVTLATLVEPGTECFLCSAYSAFALVSLPFFNNTFHLPSSWTAFGFYWVTSVTLWCIMDWSLFKMLQSGSSLNGEEIAPFLTTDSQCSKRDRVFHEWLFAWIGREFLALPIWLWAFFGGTTVEWRGKKFWVGLDMKVHEVTEDGIRSNQQNSHSTRLDIQK